MRISDGSSDVCSSDLRFTHRAEEVWRGGQLWSLVSDTDDDGTRWRVQAERRNGMLRGSVNGAGFEAPGSILPASLWHPDTTKAQALLDTIDGRVKTVDCRDLRSEEHTSELQSLMRSSYAVFCLKKQT